ncbi:DNA-binding protein [Pseudomonas tritici]|uniref:DNA-binding protein n=1 Tax=Pseudomonas tritici TaxID=2745518 RepID=UPI00387A9706
MSTEHSGSVTQAEFNEVHRQLLLEGVTPSFTVLRKRLGNRGSNSTISKYLKAAREALATPESVAGKFPEQLEKLCRDMVDCMDGLAAERVEAERAQLRLLQKSIENQRHGLILEKETALTSLEAEKRVTADLRQRLEAADERGEQLATESSEHKTRAGSAEALNAQLRERLEQAQALNDLKDNQIAHYDDQVRTQEKQASEKLASTISAMQGELHSSHERERQLAAQLSAAERMADKSAANLTEVTRRADQSEKKLDELNALLSDLSVEQVESKKRDKQRERQLAEAIAGKAEDQSAVAKLQGQLIDAHARIERLRDDSSAENRSVIINLVDHARRVFELAQATTKKESPELQELAIAQREIERMFGSTTNPR